MHAGDFFKVGIHKKFEIWMWIPDNLDMLSARPRPTRPRECGAVRRRMQTVRNVQIANGSRVRQQKAVEFSQSENEMHVSAIH